MAKSLRVSAHPRPLLVYFKNGKKMTRAACGAKANFPCRLWDRPPTLGASPKPATRGRTPPTRRSTIAPKQTALRAIAAMVACCLRIGPRARPRPLPPLRPCACAQASAPVQRQRLAPLALALPRRGLLLSHHLRASAGRLRGRRHAPGPSGGRGGHAGGALHCGAVARCAGGLLLLRVVPLERPCARTPGRREGEPVRPRGLIFCV